MFLIGDTEPLALKSVEGPIECHSTLNTHSEYFLLYSAINQSASVNHPATVEPRFKDMLRER